MRWFALTPVLGFVVDLVVGGRRAEHAKDLEIALLRHPVRLLQRRSPRPPRLSRWEKLPIAVLTAKLRRLVTDPQARLARAVLLGQPETVLKWHRALGRRQWTSRRRPLAAAVEALLLRLATLGHASGRSTIRDVLRRRRVPPAPQRRERVSTWRQFLAQHRARLLACDFFTAETLFLQTNTVVFFLEIGTRRVPLAGCTAHPTAAWVTQQARQLAWRVQDAGATPSARRPSTRCSLPRGSRLCARRTARRTPTPTRTAGSARRAWRASTSCSSPTRRTCGACSRST